MVKRGGDWEKGREREWRMQYPSPNPNPDSTITLTINFQVLEGERVRAKGGEKGHDTYAELPSEGFAASHKIS